MVSKSNANANDSVERRLVRMAPSICYCSILQIHDGDSFGIFLRYPACDFAQII